MELKALLKPSVAIALTLAISACSENIEENTEPAATVLKPVRTLTVNYGAVIERSFSGVVNAAKSAEIGFRVNGELQQVLTKEGDQVKQGQILARLDQADFRIKLDVAQAEFDRAQADFKRASSLLKQSAISASDYEKLKAQLSNAQAQLDAANKNIEYTVLKAPFDGIIAKQYVSNFEKVSASAAFAVVQDLSQFEISIDIPESVMIRVKRTTTPNVHAVFDGNENTTYPLTFKEVATRADEKTQTYNVKFVMDSPKDLNLLPGMSALVTASESTTETHGHIYVPAHTVLEDSQGRFVYIAKPIEAGVAEIQRRSVVVGSLNENGIQVIQGLDAGDKVVTAGMSKMTQGLKARLMAED